TALCPACGAGLQPPLATHPADLLFAALAGTPPSPADHRPAADDAMTCNARGVALSNQGQYAAALTDFSRAIEIDPRFGRAYHHRGYAHAALKQHDRAIADFDRAIALDPRFAAAHSNRGLAFAACGQHDRAIADFDAALRLEPTLAMAWLNRGFC